MHSHFLTHYVQCLTTAGLECGHWKQSVKLDFVQETSEKGERAFTWPNKSDGKTNKQEAVMDSFLRHEAALKKMACLHQDEFPALLIEDDLNLHQILPQGQVMICEDKLITQSLGHQRENRSAVTWCAAAILFACRKDVQTVLDDMALGGRVL